MRDLRRLSLLSRLRVPRVDRVVAGALALRDGAWPAACSCVTCVAAAAVFTALFKEICVAGLVLVQREAVGAEDDHGSDAERVLPESPVPVLLVRHPEACRS